MQVVDDPLKWDTNIILSFLSRQAKELLGILPSPAVTGFRAAHVVTRHGGAARGAAVPCRRPGEFYPKGLKTHAELLFDVPGKTPSDSSGSRGRRAPSAFANPTLE